VKDPEQAREAKESRLVDDNNMNVCEGHLGGYIMASDSRAPSGLEIVHGDPATWDPQLWLWTISALNVRSVLDVGCAEGHCIRFFSEYGCAVKGVDGSRLAKKHSRLPECHDVHDFTEGAYAAAGAWDMVWCCEFVEHVEEKYARHFLEAFKLARRYILLTHARPGEPGWHHVNCQTREYWIDKLDQIDFRFSALLTKCAGRVARGGHFKSKGLVFVRRHE